MAYAEDVMTLARLERYRLIGVVAAVAMTVLSLAFDISLGPVRFLTWLAVGGICFLEARVTKRLGRDAWGCWLRLALCALIAATYLL